MWDIFQKGENGLEPLFWKQMLSVAYATQLTNVKVNLFQQYSHIPTLIYQFAQNEAFIQLHIN